MATGKEAFLARLRAYLLDHSGLDQQLALIYILALSKGFVSSKTVTAARLGINAKSVPAKLSELAALGFLVAALGRGKGGTGVKGNPQRYYPLPPSQALKAKLESANQLWQEVQQFDEEMEVGPPTLEEEMVVVPNQQAAFQQLAEGIRASSRDVLAYCRDGDWWSVLEVQRAVIETRARGVPFTVVASALSSRTKEALLGAGILVHETGIQMTPFVLVDGATLYLPHKTGSLGNMYGTLRVTNKYMAQGYESFIRGIAGGIGK